MTEPPDPHLAEAWRRLQTGMEHLDRRVGDLADSHYLAGDETGAVEVTLNGRGRLIGLRLDDRLLAMGAQEVGRQINEVLWAAQEFVDETHGEALPALEAEAERIAAGQPLDHPAQSGAEEPDNPA